MLSQGLSAQGTSILGRKWGRKLLVRHNFLGGSPLSTSAVIHRPILSTFLALKPMAQRFCWASPTGIGNGEEKV